MSKYTDMFCKTKNEKHLKSSWDKQSEEFAKNRKRIKNIVFGGIIFVASMIAIIYGSIAYMALSEVEENGGVKNTIIKYGKEIKEISNAIEQE